VNPVLEIMLFPMRDEKSFGATIKWHERGSDRSMRILGGASREQLLGVIGAVFDRRPGGTISVDANAPK